MRTSKRIVAVAAGVALLLPTAGCAPDGGPATPRPGSVGPTGASPGGMPDVLVAYNAVLPELSLHPAAWGGAYAEGDELVIKYTGTEAAAAATLARLGVQRGYRLLATDVSIADLDAQVAAFRKRADAAGIRYSVIGPEYRESRVTVGIPEPDPRADALLAEVTGGTGVVHRG